MHQGPVESTRITETIVTTEVIEQLQDLKGTLCLRLLKPYDILFIQASEFRQKMEFDALTIERGAFLEQLKSAEN